MSIISCIFIAAIGTFFVCVIVYGPKDLPPHKHGLLGVLAASLVGLFAFHFTGDVVVMASPFIRGSGGCAFFAGTLLWWRSPYSLIALDTKRQFRRAQFNVATSKLQAGCSITFLIFLTALTGTLITQLSIQIIPAESETCTAIVDVYGYSHFDRDWLTLNNNLATLSHAGDYDDPIMFETTVSSDRTGTEQTARLWVFVYLADECEDCEKVLMRNRDVVDLELRAIWRFAEIHEINDPVLRAVTNRIQYFFEELVEDTGAEWPVIRSIRILQINISNDESTDDLITSHPATTPDKR